MSEELKALSDRISGPLPQLCTDIDENIMADEYRLSLSRRERELLESALRRLAAAGEQKPVAHPPCRCHDDVSRKYCLDKDRCTPIAETQPTSDAGGGVGYADGEAPWFEDEQFEERAKACKARCKKYGYTCGQGGEEDHEFEGECDDCNYDAIEVLRKKYTLSKPAAANSNASAEARLREALEPFAVLGRGLYEANQRSDQSVLIGASAEFLNLRPLIGQHFVNAHLALSPDPHASDCEKQGEAVTGGSMQSGDIISYEADEKTGVGKVTSHYRPSGRPADVTGDPIARAWKSEKNRYEMAIFGGNRPCQVTCDGKLAFTGTDEDCETFIGTRCARALLDAFTVERR